MTNAPTQFTSTCPAGPSTTMKPLIKPYPFGTNQPLPSADESEAVVTGLRKALADTTAVVIGRMDPTFETASTIYNGAIKCHGHAVVQPRHAEHVSKTVKHCRQNNLHLSVKAGGTGVHGKSLAGHVVLDLALLQDVTVDLPGTSTSLYESFQVIAKRPSISITPLQQSSKRSVLEAMGAEGDMGDQGRQKIVESPDIEMMQSPSGSGSSSSRSGSRGSSTPATSNPSDGIGYQKGSGSDHSSTPVPRTTYVNPSRTTTSSYPFVPTSFGGSSTTSLYSSSMGNPMMGMGMGMGSQQSMANTNPDAPPYTVVTFGAGVHSKGLDEVTSQSPYGSFHIPTSAFPVGAGQFLLGGFGFLGRKHGLAMDCVVEVEVVLADGRIVWLGADGHHGDFKEDEDPEDLWFAMRGAGSSFGVVTRLRSKAFYVPSVYAGNFIYVFNPLTTPSLLRHVRDCVKGSPRSLYANIIMTAGPVGTPAIVVIQLCYSGPRSEGEMYVQAIGSWTDDRCLFQDFSERTFSRQQGAIEEVLKGGRGRKWYIKSDMLKSLSDEIILQTCERFCGVPDGCTWLFEYTGGGAAGDIKDSCFPSSHRESAFTVAALHQWSHTEAPPLDTQCVVSAENWINEVIQPNSVGGPLPCFIQTPDEVPGSYGENWSRLQEIKRQFDPTHFFRHSMWPDPEEGNSSDGLPTSGQEGQDPVDPSNISAMGDKVHVAISTPTPEPLSASAPGLGPMEAGTIPSASVKEHNRNVPTDQRGVDGDGASLRASAGTA